MIAPFIEADENRVALWYCPDCRASGALMIQGLDVYDIVENLHRI